MWTAIQIGIVIRRFGFSTAVADNGLCSSACALAWLSGKEKFMGKNARIGFHAPKLAEDRPDVSPSGLAVVGAYLNEVGAKDFNAVKFLTRAPPELTRRRPIRDSYHHFQPFTGPMVLGSPRPTHPPHSQGAH